MNLSQKGRDLLINLEGGHKLEAYLDSGGIPTIGVGITYFPNGFPDVEDKARKIRMSDKIDHVQSEMLFGFTLVEFDRAVDSLTTDSINQNQFDALILFTYNVGKEAYKISELRALVNKNPNDPNIEREFFDWITVGKRYNKGLIWRRHVEANLYFGRI